MSEPLVIWLPETPEGAWTWFMSTSENGVADTEADKQALSEKDIKFLHVILPGQWVRILDHDLPQMKEADRKTAIRFFIEENIAAGIDEHHIVLAQAPDKRVAIISDHKMKDILAVLKQAGLNPDGLYADFDCLRHELRPLKFGGRVIFPQAGYTVDADWAEDNDVKTPAIEDLSSDLNLSAAINLRTQKYARRSDLNIDLRQFARAAALVIGLGVSFLLWQGLQARALQQNADYLRSQAAAQYAEATGETAPANPALVMTKAVNNNAPTADFLSLSNILYSSVSRIDGITVETLQFDSGKNQLTLRLNYPAFESASDLERAVTAQGGTFQSGGVREYSGELIGDAVLSSGGGS